MSLILPLNHIHPTLKEEAFHLSLPNPILGKSHYLILPLAAGLAYKAVETQAKARRHLILGNRMWVTEGKMEFDAINDGGEQIRVQLKLRKGSPSRFFWKTAKVHLFLGSHKVLGPTQFFSWFLPDKTRTDRSHLLFYCEKTERRVELRWKTNNRNMQEAWLNSLRDCRCH